MAYVPPQSESAVAEQPSQRDLHIEGRIIAPEHVYASDARRWAAIRGVAFAEPLLPMSEDRFTDEWPVLVLGAMS